MITAKAMTSKILAKVGAVTMNAARTGYEFRHASAAAANAITGDAKK